MQVGPIGEVNQQTLGGVQVARCGQGQGRRPATGDPFQGRRDPRGEVGGCGGTNGQDATQGRSRRHRWLGTVAGGSRAGEARVCLRLCPNHPRHIFLQNEVEVSAAESVGADSGAARGGAPTLPLLSLVDEAERAGGEINVRVWSLGVERGRQHLLVNGENRLEHTCRTGPSLQVADIALGRAKPDAAAFRHPKDLTQTLDFGQVADAGAGAVGLDQRTGSRIKPGIAPGSLDGVDLTDRVGCGDALALAVGRGSQATDDRVDRIAVALGIFQALEQENRAALAHHKAIGPIAEGAGARGAECADLAEFDKGGRSHVPVNAAGQHGVHPVVGEQFHSGINCGEGGGAGGIGNEIRAAQVQQVGHTSGHNVGQFTGHRVFGDLRECPIHLVMELRDQLGLGGGGHGAEDRRGP